MKRILIFIALLLASIALQAGELVFHWNKMAESKVYDIEFYPDNNYFILCTANDIQIRNTEDGEIFKKYQFGATEIEFTPDSSKVLLIPTGGETGRIQLRNIKDMSLIKEYTLPKDENGLNHYFKQLAVDPKRPYVYAIATKMGEIPYQGMFVENKIIVYNYETMEEIKDITPVGFENKFYDNIAISSDGKYLSFINQGESYLKTIDLSTQKEIQSFKVCESYEGGNSGAPVCIKFSEINSDKIYFSGNFPQSVEGKNNYYGLLVYSISENKIIDSTFGVGAERVSEGYFSLIKNEERLLFTNKFVLYVINLKDLLKEISSETYYISQQILYSKSKDIILGRGEQHITKLTYKNGSGVKPEQKIYKTLYPNPTTGTVNIEFNCKSAIVKYELYDSNGIIIKSNIIENSSSIFQLDLSNYSNSIYFIKLYCGSDVQTFKIIKEN